MGPGTVIDLRGREPGIQGGAAVKDMAGIVPDHKQQLEGPGLLKTVESMEAIH